MEILFISHKYPPTIGGMEKQCFELIAHAEQDHKVHKLVYTGVCENKLAFFKKLKSRVKVLLNQHPEIQIIHLNDGLMGLFTLWLKRYTSIPVVITFHGLDLVFPNRFYQWFINKRLSRYDGFICVSTATANECYKRNFDAQKVFVVPNGVDHKIAEYKAKSNTFRKRFEAAYNIDLSNKKIIATLGRPVQRKGFSWFLEQVVPALDDDTIVIMVGPVQSPKDTTFWERLLPSSLKQQIQLAKGGLSDEAKIAELLSQPAIDSKVIQTGKLAFNDVLEVLSLAQLFVMPNVKRHGDAEGFGLVALEASLRRTVVLASDLEGIPEAIQDKQNGFLLPSEVPQAWIEKINQLLSDPVRLEEMGAAFQQFTLNNYSWHKMTQEYIDVFHQLETSKSSSFDNMVSSIA